MFDSVTHNTNIKSQIKQSQEDISTQEMDMMNRSEEKQNLKKHCQLTLENDQSPDSPKNNLNICNRKNSRKDFQDFIVDMALWGSPEIVRKEDTSMELEPVLHVTPFSEAENTDFQVVHVRSSLQGDNSLLMGFSNLYENGGEEAVLGVDVKSPVFSESTYSVDDNEHVIEKNMLVSDISYLDFIVFTQDCFHPKSLLGDWL